MSKLNEIIFSFPLTCLIQSFFIFFIKCLEFLSREKEGFEKAIEHFPGNTIEAEKGSEQSRIIESNFFLCGFYC